MRKPNYAASSHLDLPIYFIYISTFCLLWKRLYETALGNCYVVVGWPDCVQNTTQTPINERSKLFRLRCVHTSNTSFLSLNHCWPKTRKEKAYNMKYGYFSNQKDLWRFLLLFIAFYSEIQQNIAILMVARMLCTITFWVATQRWQ